MKKFEYRTEQFDLRGGIFTRTKINKSDFDNLVNSLGAKGWELVSCSTAAESYGRSNFLFLIFKREIEE